MQARQGSVEGWAGLAGLTAQSSVGLAWTADESSALLAVSGWVFWRESNFLTGGEEEGVLTPRFAETSKRLETLITHSISHQHLCPLSPAAGGGDRFWRYGGVEGGRVGGKGGRACLSKWLRDTQYSRVRVRVRRRVLCILQSDTRSSSFPLELLCKEVGVCGGGRPPPGPKSESKRVTRFSGGLGVGLERAP